MIHSINSIRVIAEFFVVKYHLFHRVDSAAFRPVALNSLACVDLMSFFFILSGFVCMHAHINDKFSQREECIRFFMAKLARMYPIYILLIFITLVTFPIPDNPWFWSCLTADILLVSPWIYCMKSNGSRAVGWYMSVLFWLWMMFPLFCGKMNLMFQEKTWLKIIFLYLFSLLPWIYLLYVPWEYFDYSMIPLFRLPEFMIGCAINFTTHQRIHTFWFLSVLLFLSAYYVVEFFVFPHLPHPLCMGLANKIGMVHSPVTYDLIPDPTCTPIWSIFRSRMALGWAVLIQWIACTELQGGSTFFLQWGVFKSLSLFSLQVYMGQEVLSALLTALASFTGPINQLFQMDTMMIGTYGLCYLFYLFVQPWLDRIGHLMFIAWHPKTEVNQPSNAINEQLSMVTVLPMTHLLPMTVLNTGELEI